MRLYPEVIIWLRIAALPVQAKGVWVHSDIKRVQPRCRVLSQPGNLLECRIKTQSPGKKKFVFIVDKTKKYGKAQKPLEEAERYL